MNVCHYFLDNGQRCRCYPNRNSEFCRHHQPSRLCPSRRRSASSHSQPDDANPRPRTRAEMSLGWRGYHAWIRESQDTDGFEEVIDFIMSALGDRNISPRSAGRLLQAIEDRRRQLTPPPALHEILLEQVAAIQNRVESRKTAGAPC